MALRPHLRHRRLALELHRRVPLRQPHLIVPRRKLRLRGRLRELAVHTLHPVQPHAAPRVTVHVQLVIKACLSTPVQFAVQKIRHSPVREHIREAHSVLRQVALHAIHAIQRFARKLRQHIIAAVMLRNVLHEQRRPPIVRKRVARLVRPEVQLRLRPLQEYINEARLVARNLGRHLRHALVHPHILAQVLIPVDRMLKLVRQHAEVLPAAGAQPVAIHHDHLTLVAVGMSRARVRVARREVASRSHKRRMQHRQARVAVNARLPNIADGCHNRRANFALEHIRRLLEFLRRKLRLLIRVPVCVLAHRKQLRIHLVHPPLDEVGHEEPLAMPNIAAVQIRRQRACQRRTPRLSPAEAQRQRKQVAHRRLILHWNGNGRQFRRGRCGRRRRGRQLGHGSRGRFACTDGGRRWRGHRVSHIHLPRLHNTRLLPLTRNAQQRSDHNR